MRKFAQELSETVHALGTIEAVGIKVASADACMMAQNTLAKCCSDLYSVMYKKAMAETLIGKPTHVRVVTFLDKVAAVISKPEIDPDLQMKIAAAVLADEAITEAISGTEDEDLLSKFAESRSYGRELVAELLRRAI